MLQSYGLNHLGVNTLGLPGNGVITPIELDEPSNLSMEVVSHNKIILYWDDNSDNEDGFSIERTAVAGGLSGWAEIDTVVAGVETYEDITCDPNTLYYYRVCMYIGALKSDYTGVVFGRTHINTLTHNATTTVIIGNAETDIGIVINYSATRSALKQLGEIQILIAYKDYVYGVPSHIWEFDDIGLTITSDVSGTDIRVQFIVDNSSVNDITINYNLNVIAGTKIISPIPNADPSNLTVTTISASELDIAFQINSTNHDGHYLERSATGTSAWSVIATLTGSENTYPNTGLNDSEKWFYRVRGYRGTHNSDYTAIVAGETWLIVAAAEARGLDPYSIMLTFDKDLDVLFVPVLTSFAVICNGLPKDPAIISYVGPVVYVKLSTRLSVGDVITIAYTEPGSNWIRSLFGTKVMTFAAMAVTNNVSDIAPTSIYDGNTTAWLDIMAASTFTIKSNYLITEWRDKQFARKFIPNGTADAQCPTKLGSYVYMAVGGQALRCLFTLPQPVMVYAVIMLNSWNIGTIWLDGGSNMVMYDRVGANPNPSTTTIFSATTTDLTLAVWHIVRFCFNGSGSRRQTDENTAITGTYSGATAPGGITIGAGGGYGAPRALNIRELIVRTSDDAGQVETDIYNYLKTKYTSLGRLVGFGDTTLIGYSSVLGVTGMLTRIFTEGYFGAVGSTASDALTSWNTSKGDWVQARTVIIQTGLFDLYASASGATVKNRLQALINQLRIDLGPTAKIMIGCLTPARTWLGETKYAQWLIVNEAIRGEGSNPITGVDARVSSHLAILGDANNYLLSAYDYSTPDGMHMNTAGRIKLMEAYDVALTQLGY